MIRATALLWICCTTVPSLAIAQRVSLGELWRAYEEGEFHRARQLALRMDPKSVLNTDYRAFALAQSRAMLGDYRTAEREFELLATERDSRFAEVARWRAIDCRWMRGDRQGAAAAYRKLLARASKAQRRAADLAVPSFRVAEAARQSGDKSRAEQLFRRFVIEYPLHPLADRARAALPSKRGSSLSPDERIARAVQLRSAKKWHEAIAELQRIGDEIDESTRRRRDYEMGMTFFKMRRQYGRAGELLLAVYPHMGGDADRALFHGARALSRADRDKEAIRWYQRLVAQFPGSRWAPEAQFLSGWLELNMGNYREAVPYLERMLQRYRSSRWAKPAKWFLGLSRFLAGQLDEALPIFESLAGGGGRLEGGRGHYWQGRTLQLLGRKQEAVTEYRRLVGRFPWSWYALLARSRLAELGIEIGAFGDAPGDPADVMTLAKTSAYDEDLARVDELIAAGLGTVAADELRRRERGILRRLGRDRGIAAVLERYRRAGNWSRPWMLAVIYGGRRALDRPAEGPARAWWEHAYPRAYRELVERYRDVGGSPPFWLYSIMRKESGFDPHVHSYADARGLMQMIPPTTKQVATAMGMDYTEDLLFEPEANIKTASWYIGRLFQKFKGQVPIAAGSYNSGPKAVMRWLEKNRGRPIDEWVELVSYSQTRGYMQKVTETYARYLYLYTGNVYEQPLTVDSDYVKNELTY